MMMKSIFVLDSEIDAVCDLIDKLEESLVKKVELCHRCDDFHISLSRTFVLKYHLISAFSSSLHKCLTDVERYVQACCIFFCYDIVCIYKVHI